jgi:hypothetical protein
MAKKIAVSHLSPHNKKTGFGLKPVLPLLAEKKEGLEEDKSNYISLELRSRADGPKNSTQVYKKFIKKFEEGTPQEWIDLMRDVKEVWTQNSITSGNDRAATVRSLLRGDSLTAFETALEDQRGGGSDAVAEVSLTPEMVQEALDSVTRIVFPHRALEIQKLWMQRGMKKPFDLSTRNMAAAINRINNALPLFPGATEASKFSPEDLVSLLEWSLPVAWRRKFDYDGYIPTQDSKAKLIEKCEAIERSQEESKGKKDEKKDAKAPYSKPKADGAKSYHYCKVHGKNTTHDTTNCNSLKKKSSNGPSDKGKPKSFSTTALRKEVNMLAKCSSKRKVLDLYSAAVAKEKAKLSKKSKQNTAAEDESSASDSDMSVQIMEMTDTIPKKRIRFCEQTEEEKAFLKKIQKEDDESTDN